MKNSMALVGDAPSGRMGMLEVMGMYKPQDPQSPSFHLEGFPTDGGITGSGFTGTRRIGDVAKPCISNQHHPPTMMVWPDGVYEHVCPSCGARSTFTVVSPTC